MAPETMTSIFEAWISLAIARYRVPTSTPVAYNRANVQDPDDLSDAAASTPVEVDLLVTCSNYVWDLAPHMHFSPLWNDRTVYKTQSYSRILR